MLGVVDVKREYEARLVRVIVGTFVNNETIKQHQASCDHIYITALWSLIVRKRLIASKLVQRMRSPLPTPFDRCRHELVVFVCSSLARECTTWTLSIGIAYHAIVVVNTTYA